MRIIGGIHRSRKIEYPKNNQITKPTADNVREAVFNMLPDIKGALVCDLFAGSGAYGLESISRGAKSVYFNDYNLVAVKTIKTNLDSLKERSKATITQLDYEDALKYIEKNNLIFDYIFIDPPYYDNLYFKSVFKVTSSLKENGIIILEIDRKIDINNLLESFKITKNRTYGRKRIIFITVN